MVTFWLYANIPHFCLWRHGCGEYFSFFLQISPSTLFQNQADFLFVLTVCSWLLVLKCIKPGNNNLLTKQTELNNWRSGRHLEPHDRVTNTRHFMESKSNFFITKALHKILSDLWRMNYSDKYSCRCLHNVFKQILIPGPFR